MVGAVMAISDWSSLWRSVELGDRKWRLNRNGEKMETNYGDQNFTHHEVESTYLSISRIETYKVLDVPRVGNIDFV